MKRLGLALLAAVMVVGLAGCAGDDAEFDMNGTWLVSAAWIRVGCDWELAPSFEWSIAQDGTSLTITQGDSEIHGTFNPDTGSFDLAHDIWDVHLQIRGNLTSDTSFQADLRATRTRDTCSGEASMKGELLRR